MCFSQPGPRSAFHAVTGIAYARGRAREGSPGAVPLLGLKSAGSRRPERLKAPAALKGHDGDHGARKLSFRNEFAVLSIARAREEPKERGLPVFVCWKHDSAVMLWHSRRARKATGEFYR